MYNFKQVMGSTTYKAWKLWEVDDYLVGKYVSQGLDSYGNPKYNVEVVEASFESDSPKVGSMFTLNSSGALNKAFEEVVPGQIVKVIYKGVDTVSKGKFKGKEYHSMEVLVARSDTPVEDESEDLV